MSASCEGCSEYKLSLHYEVRTAENGEQALERINERLPDLITLDVMMSRMDGAVHPALQDRPEPRTIPFFFTAKTDLQSRARGMQAGANGYLTKPFEMEDLLGHIANVLGHD